MEQMASVRSFSKAPFPISRIFLAVPSDCLSAINAIIAWSGARARQRAWACECGRENIKIILSLFSNSHSTNMQYNFHSYPLFTHSHWLLSASLLAASTQRTLSKYWLETTKWNYHMCTYTHSVPFQYKIPSKRCDLKHTHTHAQIHTICCGSLNNILLPDFRSYKLRFICGMQALRFAYYMKIALSITLCALPVS